MNTTNAGERLTAEKVNALAEANAYDIEVGDGQRVFTFHEKHLLAFARAIESELANAAPVAAPADSAEEQVVQQAQIWAQEARSQRATVLSILRYFGLPEHDWEALRLIQEKQAAPADQVRDQALAFVDHIISGMFEGGDWPGADVQELAVKYGLLKEVTMQFPCGGDGACQCAQNEATFPATCYRKTYVSALRTSGATGEQEGA